MPYDRIQRKQGPGAASPTAATLVPSRPFSLPRGYLQYYGLSAAQAPHEAAATFQRGAGGAASEVPYRAEMERAFGQDFSGVRAHLGQQEAMGQLGAHAATAGEQVVFGTSSPDRRLVAHELTHVVQNRKAGVQDGAVQGEGGVSDPSHSAEQEAELVAERVVQGEPVQVSATPAAPVQRMFDWFWALVERCKGEDPDEDSGSDEEPDLHSHEEAGVTSGEPHQGQQEGKKENKEHRAAAPDQYQQAKEAAKVKLKEEAAKVRERLEEANAEERGQIEWKAADLGLKDALKKIGNLHKTQNKRLPSAVKAISEDLKRLEDSEICQAIRARQRREAQAQQDQEQQRRQEAEAAQQAAETAQQAEWRRLRLLREDRLTDECEAWILQSVEALLRQDKYWTYTGPTIRVDSKYKDIRYRMQPRMHTSLHGEQTGYPGVTYYVTGSSGKGYGFNITGHDKKDITRFNLHITFDA